MGLRVVVMGEVRGGGMEAAIWESRSEGWGRGVEGEAGEEKQNGSGSSEAGREEEKEGGYLGREAEQGVEQEVEDEEREKGGGEERERVGSEGGFVVFLVLTVLGIVHTLLRIFFPISLSLSFSLSFSLPRFSITGEAGGLKIGADKGDKVGERGEDDVTSGGGGGAS